MAKLSQEEQIIRFFLTDNENFQYAYEKSEAFKKYWDSLSEEEQKPWKRQRTLQKVSEGADGIRKGLFVLGGPIGWGLLGIGALASKKSEKKKENVREELVKSEYFEALFNAITKV